MELTITIRGTVATEAEAKIIADAVKLALVPHKAKELSVTSHTVTRQLDEKIV